MGPRWAPRGHLDRYWKGLGRILGGFGEGLGRVWGRIWEDLVPFEQFVGKFWTYLKRLGPAGVDSIIGPPRWSAKRHNSKSVRCEWLYSTRLHTISL